MKRCPTCNKTFTDANLSFCIDDGTPLVSVAADNNATVATPQFGDERKTSDRADGFNASGYQPPSYVPPAGTTPQRKVWPWVVGILGLLLLGLIGLSIAAALLLPRMIRNAQNERATTAPPEYNSNSNASSDSSNADSNSSGKVNGKSANANVNSSVNSNSDINATAPTDTEVVLAQLTNLEHEWTVANINADKKALGRILADDYAGPSINGQIQGKAEYLKTLTRDITIQKWEFKNLKVTLHGDRATLTGTLILQRKNQNEAYTFTDKFVWRDARWQATGSVVTPIQQNLSNVEKKT